MFNLGIFCYYIGKLQCIWGVFQYLMYNLLNLRCLCMYQMPDSNIQCIYQICLLMIILIFSSYLHITAFKPTLYTLLWVLYISEQKNESEEKKKSDKSEKPTKKTKVNQRHKRVQHVPFTHSWLATILKGHSSPVLGFDFSPNGKYLISTAEGKRRIFCCTSFISLL